jgi:hypothetical protein
MSPQAAPANPSCFQYVTERKLWHTSCHSPCMNIKILRELSYQITQGNPLWGLALLNEYTDVSAALRDVFIRAFHDRLGPISTRTPLAIALIDGTRAAELFDDDRRALGSRALTKSRPIPCPGMHRPSFRWARRQRLSTGSTYRRPLATTRLGVMRRPQARLVVVR